ncbi:MAG: TonB family protein [Verrucomicrobia bacterium]|nr:TonB family protein [Verrucomicrobiota bacterium]
MPRNLRFWSNVALITAAHVAIIVGLIYWSPKGTEGSSQSIMWLNSGAGDGVVLEKKNPLTKRSSAPRTETKTESIRLPEVEDDRPFLASAPSEIQLATPKPSPTAAITPKPTPYVKGAPQPKPKPTAKPTPKPTPKPKEAIAKTKSSPKPKPKHEDKEEADEKSATADNEKRKIVIAKNETPPPKPAAAEKSSATQTGSGKAATAGVGGGHAGGSVNESQFGWYGSMLHDRFYSEWVQPTSVATSGGKNSVLVKLRIEKNGRVSSFEIVRSSGNAELDESVKAITGRLTKVEPLPDGLGKGDHYDVKINFELNSE